MEFGVRGTPTPRAQQRQIPGSARHPHSARVNRNPITGEDYNFPAANHNVNNHNSNTAATPQAVPSLNLKYLRDLDEPTGAINLSLRDYKLDTPSTASTVSWGTARSGMVYKQDIPQKQASVHSSPVPELSLGMKEKPPSARKVQKQPTAWDKAPVPEDVPAPSARHQQMYQQYSDEMKQAYRTHSNPTQVSEEEIRRTMQAMKEKGQLYSQGRGDDSDDSDDDDRNKEDVSEDVVDERWKKQRYTVKQMHKKLDAEGLLEQNKKFKLMETVMIDQLSRAVISDPEQDQRNTVHGGSTSRRAPKGTNRYLHDSKVSTRSTATENLLSRRVRFGARIMSRNGRDAVRELTGFFFQVDHSLTVYEFKQFGKSAKAIPFIQRGAFHHPSGPKIGQPYSLSDIYSGADLQIPTKGQQALSAELGRSKYITLRITDVDEEERFELAEEAEDTARSEGASQLDYENRQFLLEVQATAQTQIRKRGIKTITGLGRHYRQMDKDGTGVLLQHDLERGLLRFRIDLPPQVLEQVFDIVDPDGERRLDYCFFMRTILGQMNEYRKALVRKAFSKVDTHKQGVIILSDIKKFFNANCPYRPGSDADSTMNALQAFLEAIRSSPRQEEVSFMEFEEYYEGLSLGLEVDQDFANVLRNTWNI
ncbi:hypothetical protein ACOMHN_029815 [Nucella lapillus]